MSAAHVCDECKNVAPLEQALGWWTVEAMTASGATLLRMFEKEEYHFCSWQCMAKTSSRFAGIISGVPA